MPKRIALPTHCMTSAALFEDPARDAERVLGFVSWFHDLAFRSDAPGETYASRIRLARSTPGRSDQGTVTSNVYSPSSVNETPSDWRVCVNTTS